MTAEVSVRAISRLLSHIRHPARLEILLTIGEGEACVCHLEAALGYRQAYISQHLMALRKAGLLAGRREGRFIFYRLRNPELLDFIRRAGEVAGIAPQELDAIFPSVPLPRCYCPQCVAEIDHDTFLTPLEQDVGK